MMRLPILKRNYSKALLGIVSVEFTILMAFVYVPFVLGTIEIGRVLYQYNTLTKSLRESAKYISLNSATLPTYAAQVTIAKNLAVFGNIGGTGSPIVPGLTTAKITIATSNAGSAGTVAIKLVKVTATGYQLGYITSFVSGGGALTFNDISVTMRQATT